jgi:uncharacterized DUF497 family protein
VKYFDWNEEKNHKLKEERDISFEEVINAINDGDLLDLLEHPNRKKYVGQKIMVVRVADYVYLVPMVEDKEKVFLTTIIPSRKATKEYLLWKGAKKL